MKNAKLAKRKPQNARARRSAKPLDLQVPAPAREDEGETLLRLERMLTRAQGFALAFARVNVPTQRAELVKEIHRRVERQGIEIIEIDFQAPVQDFLNDLLRRLAKVYLTKLQNEPARLAVAESAPRYAVFVYGLENSIPSSETYHPVLSVINYKRENFRQHLAAPLVIWLPEYALQALIEGAPDFWAWRSGVFEFVAPREEISKTWRIIEPEHGQIELSNMRVEEKRKRIHLLSGLLAEYETKENADSPEIMPIRFDLLHRLGTLHYFLGEYRQALEFHQRAIKIAEKSNHQAGIAYSFQQIGLVDRVLGDYDAALIKHEKALKIFEALDDRTNVAASFHHLGVIHQACGDYAMALAEYEKAYTIFETLSERAKIGASLHQIGAVHQLRGDYETALVNYEKALQIAEERGDRAGIAASLHHIGTIHQARGDYILALSEYKKSMRIAEELGDLTGVAVSLHQIGMIHQVRGDYAAALSEYEIAKMMFEQIGDLAGVAQSVHQIGNIYLFQGKHEKASSLYHESLKIAERLGDQNAIAKTLHQIGNIHYFRGEYAAALPEYEKSLKIAEKLNDRAGKALTRGQIGALFTQTGHYAEAFEHLLFAFKTFADLRSPDVEASIKTLKNLRAKWGAENFDAAWREKTGEATPA